MGHIPVRKLFLWTFVIAQSPHSPKEGPFLGVSADTLPKAWRAKRSAALARVVARRTPAAALLRRCWWPHWSSGLRSHWLTRKSKPPPGLIRGHLEKRWKVEKNGQTCEDSAANKQYNIEKLNIYTIKKNIYIYKVEWYIWAARHIRIITFWLRTYSPTETYWYNRPSRWNRSQYMNISSRFLGC